MNKVLSWRWADWVASKLGYYAIQPDNKDLVANLSNLVYEKTNQVNALVNAIGDLQLQHDTDNLVIAALVALTGEETVELTIPYLAEIEKQGLVVAQDANSEKMTLTLVTEEETNAN